MCEGHVQLRFDQIWWSEEPPLVGLDLCPFYTPLAWLLTAVVMAECSASKSSPGSSNFLSVRDSRSRLIEEQKEQLSDSRDVCRRKLENNMKITGFRLKGTSAEQMSWTFFSRFTAGWEARKSPLINSINQLALMSQPCLHLSDAAAAAMRIKWQSQ